MARRIVIVQGHPDPGGGHFCHALADAYAEGARDGGHEVTRIDVAALALPPLHSQSEWAEPSSNAGILESQRRIERAEHIVLIYPLWLGTMPAVLKGFLEQVLRPGFAVTPPGERGGWHKLLKGRDARVVVTMGMPALAYRLLYRAHSLKSLERNILRFVGIGPVRETLFGLVDASPARRRRLLKKMQRLGRQGN